MKVKEIIEARRQQTATVQPSLVKQQARVGKVMGQIAASDAQQAPTEMDKVMAMRQMATMKKQTDKNYAARLQRQQALATQRTQLRAPTTGGRAKR